MANAGAATAANGGVPSGSSTWNPRPAVGHGNGPAMQHGNAPQPATGPAAPSMPMGKIIGIVELPENVTLKWQNGATSVQLGRLYSV